MPAKKKTAKQPADEPAKEEAVDEAKDEKDEPVVVDDRALHSRRPE